jgi:hypothetical protein
MQGQPRRYHPEQRVLEEEEQIHTLLSYVATELPSSKLNEVIDPGVVFAGVNQDSFMNLTMHRMVAEGLITTELSRNGRLSHIVRATPQGIRVAQYPGGYHSYAAVKRNTAQQEYRAKIENERLNRQVANATIDAAESARISTLASQKALRISKVAIAIPSLIALAALAAQLVSSNDTAAELAIAKRQIKQLQQQVKVLSGRK